MSFSAQNPVPQNANLQSSNGYPVDIILVPQGAEHQAVLNGLRMAGVDDLQVLTLPMGPEPVRRRLEQIQPGLSSPQGMLLMGLGGSLVPELSVGAVTMVEDCVASWTNGAEGLKGDRPLLDWIASRLGTEVKRVRSLTSDRLISTAQAKRALNALHHAAVVDMEGYPVLEHCQMQEIPSAVVRVVSDGCHHDVPDISGAIDENGVLNPLPLAVELMRQPIAATRLIRGSLKGLKVLERVTQTLFQPDEPSHQ